MNGQAALKFLASGTPEGFASKAVSSDNDANPSVIVRELIQNSLDAATPPGSQVRVTFEFTELAVSEIPGIDNYRAAFDAAKRTNTHAPEAAEAQIERITQSLAEERIPVLQILDNGVGLDTPRTNALLSDGMTNKVGAEARSAGSYGLGHYTAFPASDLQYVLYGGITRDGARTMSGHAILASHFNGNGELLGKDGYFIRGEPRPDIRNRYRFAEDAKIPTAVGSVLDRIEDRHRHGTAVLLLGFNNFREEKDPFESVLRVASRHFYPVIRTGRLLVQTQKGSDITILDEFKAAELLQSGRRERRRRSRSESISGSKAYAIWRTLDIGEKADAETEFGKVKLYVRPADTEEATRISLFRSGMFITDSVPLHQTSQFAEYRRFNAVILIDTPGPEDQGKAFELVRQAEGEKHASIDKKRLPKMKRAQLDLLFRDIRDALKKIATRDDTDVYAPEGFMELEVTADAERINPRHTTQAKQTHSSKPREFTPVPDQVDILPDGPGREKKPRPDPPPRPAPSPRPISKRKGRRVPVSATARLAGRNVRKVVRATEDIANATLRLLADQGADASCTNPLADQPLHSRLVGHEGSYVQEVRVGKLNEGQRRELNVELQDALPEQAVLKVDVMSRTMSKRAGDSN